MNVYLCKVLKWFGGYDEFTVSAENRDVALKKGCIFVRQSGSFSGDRHNLNEVRVVKKIPLRKQGALNIPHCEEVIGWHF